MQPENWQFIDKDGTFRLQNPHLTNYLYYPLVNEAGMMSVVTPTLHGALTTGHNTYFSEPLSIESLHNSRSARNFWVHIVGHGPWSLTGNSAPQIEKRFNEDAEQTELTAGLLWHTLQRENSHLGLKAEITNIVPPTNDQVELMRVTLTNTGAQPLELTPTAAIPIFGRSADNLRDHRHVTSLLHRITCTQHGVLVRPTLSFDERGHLPNTITYAVLGCDDRENPPLGFTPVLEDFLGEGGSLDWPRAIVENHPPAARPRDSVDGYEALGGLQFPKVILLPGESRSWVLVMAVFDAYEQARNEKKQQKIRVHPRSSASDTPYIEKYGSVTQFEYWLSQTKKFWAKKLDTLKVETGDPRFDGWLRWVAIQPTLRRLYGNSFMPYHDYGRGGRGWRDLWQDILALLLMEPDDLDKILLGNFAGVRIDGSNATIIGNAPGEFKADRNNIPRVWMDHGAWPFLTTKLYIDHTGDIGFLLREKTYFKDQFTHWTKSIDESWTPESGTQLRTKAGAVYHGTVLEHLLVQHLTAFFNVGDHNNLRLEDADWNDGLDMAHEKGESVAFTALYASNLRELSELVLKLDEEYVSIAVEILPLLDSLNPPSPPFGDAPRGEGWDGGGVDYANPAAKRAHLTAYFERVNESVSGERAEVSLTDLASDLRAKADHLYAHLQENEWVQDKAGRGWFNGYYDNDGQRLEGEHSLGVRMTLTGQVFALMGGIASIEQAHAIIQAADHYLYNPKIGGYLLNTDFGEVLLNLGRAFGFAYGHKENGAMFSHMAVMYANALYQRGFAAEGFRALDAIYQHSADFEKSRMYPGIPEYFSDRGRGMYPYLTGSASWYLLTLVTQVFGVRGELGDLVLAPMLCRAQFDAQMRATIHTLFAGRRLNVCYKNPGELDVGEYKVENVLLNGQKLTFTSEDGSVKIARAAIARLPEGSEHLLEVVLTNP
ncbi:MAG: cellobiose phosphorylase [Anaerolineae bacterium]|nr:cellobiose phosphorylase [Anaerolineae bacterium]